MPLKKKRNWQNLPAFMYAHKFYKKDLENGGDMNEVPPDAANLVSSYLFDVNGVRMHRPVLDLDIHSVLLNSTTPGHGHLFIDKIIPEETYFELLRVLNKAGIIQDGIIKQQVEGDKMTCARLPGIVKTTKSQSSGAAAKLPATIHYPYKEEGDDKTPDDELLEKLAMVKSDPSNMTILPSNVPGTMSTGAMTFSAGTIGDYSIKTEAPKLTSWMQSAMLEFEKLAEISYKTGQSLKDLIKAWDKFKEKQNPASKVVKKNDSDSW